MQQELRRLSDFGCGERLERVSGVPVADSCGGVLVSCALSELMAEARRKARGKSAWEVQGVLLGAFAALGVVIAEFSMEAEVESWFVSASDAVYLDFMRWMGGIWVDWGEDENSLIEILQRLQANERWVVSEGLRLQELGSVWSSDHYRAVQVGH